MSTTQTYPTISKDEELISEDVIITGDVKEGSIIDTHKLLVEGKTLPFSTQFSKFSTIATHQGTLRCHEATVTLLDAGQIHATTVHADTVIGGEIFAQDVYIKHLKDNATIYASRSITIEQISGENNRLFINYKEVPILISKIELIKDDLEELNSSFNDSKKKNSSLENEFEVEIARLKEEILSIESSVKTAKITIKKQVKTKNTITFQVDDEHQISYTTTKGIYAPFYLVFDNDTITLTPTTTTLTLNS